MYMAWCTREELTRPAPAPLAVEPIELNFMTSPHASAAVMRAFVDEPTVTLTVDQLIERTGLLGEEVEAALHLLQENQFVRCSQAVVSLTEDGRLLAKS